MAKKKPDSEKYTELIPPEGDKEVGRKIFQILTEIIDDKINLGLHEKWLEHYKLGKNKHWKKTAKKIPLISGNLLFVHRQRTVNMLTDNNPTFNVVKVGEIEEKQEDLFLHLQRATDFWWRETEQQDVLESSVINGETYGVTIEKVIFNPELEYEMGEVETIEVDPFQFGCYPVKWKKNQKAEANLHYYPMSVREIKRRWPAVAKDVKPDSEYLKELGGERREVALGQSSTSSLVKLAGVVSELINKVFGASIEAEEALVVECWTKDYSMVKETVEEEREIPDPKTGIPTMKMVKVEKEQPKYKGHIRCIACCNGGDVILYDKDNPSINPTLPDEEAQKTYLYDKYPFNVTVSIKDTSNPWGMSDFEQLEWLNKEFNKSLSQFVLVKDKKARSKLINPTSSGVRNEEITNYPGILNPRNAMESQGIRYLEYPYDTADIEKGLELFRDIFFTVAGTFELEKAQTPGRDVIAYKAIAALLEHAATMMRGKLRSYSKLIRDRGRMYVSHLQNWYTEERWISYPDKGEQKPLQIRGKELIIPARLSVVSGSTMPISKIQQREEALALFEKQAIDQEDLLEKIDWSERSEVLKRMRMGPLQEVFERMAGMGFPQQALKLLQQVSQMEDKDFEKALKEGKLPPIAKLLSGQQPEPPPEELEAKAEIQKTGAETKKLDAETILTKAKVETEKVKQDTEKAKIALEKDKLKIERAKVVKDGEKKAEKTSKGE